MKLSRRGFLKALGAIPLLGVNLPESEDELTVPEPQPAPTDFNMSQWSFTGNAGSSFYYISPRTCASASTGPIRITRNVG